MYPLSSSRAPLLLGVLLTSSIWSCLAAPADPAATITIGPPHPIPTIPASCGLGPKPPSCFTHTTTTSGKCPKLECTNGPIACPAIIKITTTEVPCSTDCCPTTPTQTVTEPCPSCITKCVIPTQTITVTTGCKSTPGGALPSFTLH